MKEHKKDETATHAEGTKIFEVYLRCVTWTRDSHGLFDYERKNIAKKNIKTQTGGKIIRLGDEIQLVSKHYEISGEARPMITLLRDPERLGNFIIKNDTFAAPPDPLPEDPADFN